MLRNILPILIATMIFTSCENKENNSGKKAYVGTYTRNEGHVNGQADGIISLNVNPKDGNLSFDKTAAKVINPSFLSKSPNGEFIFAVSELGPNDPKHGEVYSYKVEDDSLKYIDVASSDAYAPCHVISTDKFVFVANYLNGVAKLLEYNKDGEFVNSDTIVLKGSSVHEQQTGPLLHHINLSPDNSTVYITDKGSDKVWIIDIDKENAKFVKSSLTSVSVQPGAGPRHLEFTPDYKYAYTINELDNTVNSFAVDKDYKLTNLGNISTLPYEYDGYSSGAEIKVHKNGKFLYVSNRGHNSITAFKINPENGHLSVIDYYETKGDFPRGFEIDTEGKYLYIANQNSNNIVQYNINQENGELEFSGNILEVGTPVDIQF